MHIHIVTVNSGWILQKTSERLAKKFPEIFTVGHSPSMLADANFYMDVTNCFQNKSPIIDIGFFTHLHEGSMMYAPYQAIHLDHVIHKAQRYYDAFAANGFPKDKMSIAFPFEVEPFFTLKKKTIGIFQRGGFKGKGHDFLMSFFENNIVSKFKWLFVGNGWEPLKDKAEKLHDGISFTHIKDSDLQYEQYPNLYHSCDYVLIPSLWEGGPISVIEAKTCGIPIISSDVGWVDQSEEFFVDHIYDLGDSKSLSRLLSLINESAEDRRLGVASINFENFKNHIVSIVEKIKSKNV